MGRRRWANTNHDTDSTRLDYSQDIRRSDGLPAVYRYPGRHCTPNPRGSIGHILDVCP